MSDLDPSEQSLLDSLREADEPTDSDRERVRSAVLAKIALASGAAAATATTAKAAAGTATSAGAATPSAGLAALIAAHGKVAVVVVALAGVGVGAWWVVQDRPGSGPAEPAIDATVTSVPGELAPPAAPASAIEPSAPPQKAERSPAEDTETDRASSSPPSAAVRSRPGADTDDLDREMRLIGAAQQAMRQGDPGRALQLLDEHASEHPSGVLAEERAGARAIALCKAGRTSEGRSAAKRFLVDNPRSPLAARIRAACMRKTQ